ncbi:unnamed protein product [Oikopleura dioica]|uniref:Granzyme M n=1 Tax=Oikopleura dioica TaxID=34765 RepID=E4YJX9_OIKDI|nr:unnamed protein product [Oikopleura dioica]
MKILKNFIIFSLCAETNQEECGQVKREPVWSRPPTKLDNFGRVLDQNKNVGKIMGGNNADQGNFPWQAALVKNYKIFCGGTLVSPTTVVSAPHCLSDYLKPQDLLVSVGHISSTFERYHEIGFQHSRIKKIINHPDFNPTLFLNDINLLLLDIPFTITDYVRPACLPQNFEYKPENGAACVASGFGQQGTCDDNEILYATRLKSVVLEIVDNEICAEIHEEHSGEKVVNSQLCAAGFQNGMDTCKGDSGGPLVCDVDGRWTLTGVVSFGLFFGEKDIPGVYTRVTEYLDWIWKNSDLEAHRKTPITANVRNVVWHDQCSKNA